MHRGGGVGAVAAAGGGCTAGGVACRVKQASGEAAHYGNAAGVCSTAGADGVSPAAGVASGDDGRQHNAGFGADGEGWRCGEGATDHVVIGGGHGDHITGLEGSAAGQGLAVAAGGKGGGGVHRGGGIHRYGGRVVGH